MSTRDQAAELLQMLAGQPGDWPWLVETAPGEWTAEARKTAQVALDDVIESKANPAWRAVYAEAAARIRSGR